MESGLDMTYPLQRLCKYCRTEIYWNDEDTTMKDTGSWYEVEDNILHTLDKCKQIAGENQLNDRIAFEINQESARLRY